MARKNTEGTTENELQNYIKKAIVAYMRKEKIRQRKLASLMNSSQSTISKQLRSNATTTGDEHLLDFETIKSYCEAMKASLGEVLMNYEQETSEKYKQNSSKYSEASVEESSTEEFLNNIPEHYNLFPDIPVSFQYLKSKIDEPMFRPWFGTYHCYFHSTLSTEKDACFEGTLVIPEESDNGYCNVTFDFTYDPKKKLHKKYTGFLILSSRSKGAYCVLADDNEQGELTFLLMRNPDIKNTVVCCVMAMVMTISGGKGTNYPCVERMIISRAPITGPDFELVKSHLLLNDKVIRITENDFIELLKDDRLPEQFTAKFADPTHPYAEFSGSNYVETVAFIPEAWVKSLTELNEQEMQRTIDLMRLKSISPKINKINHRIAEKDIYEIFSAEYEKYRTSLSSYHHTTTDEEDAQD